jgi:hypothetical protein
VSPSGRRTERGSEPGRGRTRRIRSSRYAALPPPGPEVTLRPHSIYALGLELLVGVLGLFWFADAVGSQVGVALIGLVVAIAFGVGGPLAYRRSTHVGPDGVRIQGWWRVRTYRWADIEGFEILPHVAGRADRIGLVTRDGDRVALIHQDAKGLTMRPQAALGYYRALIERLETVRRTAGS